MPKTYTGKKFQAGFTLIELLVVIAIIGLLASIVLVLLKDAINHAKDARIATDMGQLRTLAEVYQGNKGTYTGFCNASTSPDVETLRLDIVARGGADFRCYVANDGLTYCINVKLNAAQYWCVDSALSSYSYSSILWPIPGCESSTITKHCYYEFNPK